MVMPVINLIPLRVTTFLPSQETVTHGKKKHIKAIPNIDGLVKS
jgi:hypothetical protein